MSGQVGTITVLEYNGSRNEDPFQGPLNGIKGESVTHAAALLEFNTDAISNEMLAKLKALSAAGKLDFRENIDATGKKTYQLYYSFWPKQNWDPISNSSRLESRQHDRNISRKGSEFEYAPRFREYLQPPLASFVSRLPIVHYFIPTRKGTVAPAMLMNLSKFELKYPESDHPGFKAAAIKFGEKYSRWSNIITADPKSPLAKQAESEMEASKELLFKAMFPNEIMDQKKFQAAIEPFVSFGLPEKDKASLPLITDPNGSGGLVLNAMLLHIVERAEHPERYPYNIALYNCANELLALLQAGIPKNASNSFKLALGVVPGINVGMHPPITLPGRVLRMALDAKATLINTHSHKHKIFSLTHKKERLVNSGAQIDREQHVKPTQKSKIRPT